MSNLKDWQAGAMWEAEAAAEWEAKNKDADITESIDEIGYALDHLEDVAKWLGEAANHAAGTVFQARILSVFEDMENLQVDMTSLKARMQEEARKAG